MKTSYIRGKEEEDKKDEHVLHEQEENVAYEDAESFADYIRTKRKEMHSLSIMVIF